MVWYGMVWYGMVWYNMVWYGMVLRFGMLWHVNLLIYSYADEADIVDGLTDLEIRDVVGVVV